MAPDIYPLKQVMSAIREAWEEGCPVASDSEEVVEETARVAIRGWRSSKRRRVKQSDLQRRIRDLAKGLISRFEENPQLVGRLKVDYEYLAEKIARVLRDSGPDI